MAFDHLFGCKPTPDLLLGADNTRVDRLGIVQDIPNSLGHFIGVVWIE